MCWSPTPVVAHAPGWSNDSPPYKPPVQQNNVKVDTGMEEAKMGHPVCCDWKSILRRAQNDGSNVIIRTHLSGKGFAKGIFHNVCIAV